MYCGKYRIQEKKKVSVYEERGINMRDFNKNGRIDVHDWHIYTRGVRKRYEILKRNDWPSLPSTENREDTSWGSIFATWGVVIVLSMILSALENL